MVTELPDGDKLLSSPQMSTKRHIVLVGGFAGGKCAETPRDELPLDPAEVVHSS
jgi:hypothetical protein